MIYHNMVLRVVYILTVIYHKGCRVVNHKVVPRVVYIVIDHCQDVDHSQYHLVIDHCQDL